MKKPSQRPSKRVAIMAALALTLTIVTFQLGLFASHSWNGYHWARTSNPFTVKIGDNLSPAWKPFLNVAAGDWSSNSYGITDVLDAVVVLGGANNKNCRPTSGRDEVCNGAYGQNGWLGIAQIWISGGHITQGTVKLNDTYFNMSKYNTPAWRQMVVCQEVGHTFGLDHQDENTTNPNLGTCMDYTSDPSTNQHPNRHDYEELALIYAHTDSFTSTFSSAPGPSNGDLENPSQWGQLMKSTRSGRTQVFERDFGNGHHVVTFVTWA
jgi:hypothetical protein